MAGVGPLFFGDFLLGQQKKVTRLSGRDPTQCIEWKTHIHVRPPLINCRFSMSTRATIAKAIMFIKIADPP